MRRGAARWTTACAVWIGLLGAVPSAGESSDPSVAAPSEATLERARELSWSGDYTASIALYRRLLGERPDEPNLQREAGLVLLWAGRELDAIEIFRKLLARDPGDAESRLAMGRAYWYLGRSDAALGHYLLALPALEDDPAVVAEAVQVMRDAERAGLAQHWLARGLHRHPGDPNLRVAEASGRQREGDLDGAERALEAVLTEHPEHEPAREALAAVRSEREQPLARAQRLGWAGRYREARAMLADHLAGHPDDEEAALTLARFASWSGDYPAAQAQYGELLRQRPGDRLLRTELAEVTSWRGQYARAIGLFDELVIEDPTDLRPRLGLANVHFWSGVHRWADRDLRAILAEDPGYEEAQKQLGELARLRAPALTPELVWFSDSAGFSLWRARSEFALSPRPGRTVRFALDSARASGAQDSSTGVGLVASVSERPDQRVAYGAELGGASWGGGGFSPRARAWLDWYPGYRHMLQLELRHEDAAPEVRTIESAVEGVERSALHLVHMYTGERFDSWTRLELGRYSDDPAYWTVRTVLGWSLMREPLEVDLLALATAGEFDETSPLYYSPQDLITYGLGVRLKKRLADRLDLLLIAELGQVHSEGTSGETFRVAPELIWEMTPLLELSLRYDHYESLRSGEDYTSDLVSARVRYRWPVREP